MRSYPRFKWPNRHPVRDFKILPIQGLRQAGNGRRLIVSAGFRRVLVRVGQGRLKVPFHPLKSALPKNDVLSVSGKTRAILCRTFPGREDIVASDASKIELVVRTIGARRGRAARGRPER